MSSFEEELRAAYHPSQPTREQQLKATQQDLARGREIALRWPEQRHLLKDRILPRLKNLRRSMRRSRKPKELRDLNAAFSRFNNLRLITWWHPQALWLRLRMLLYVAALLLVGVVLLLLIGLVLWLAFQAILMTTNLVGGWLR